MPDRKEIDGSEYIISSTEDADNLDPESLLGEEETPLEGLAARIHPWPDDVPDDNSNTLYAVVYTKEPEMCFRVPVLSITHTSTAPLFYDTFTCTTVIDVRMDAKEHLRLMTCKTSRAEATFLECDGVKTCMFEPVEGFVLIRTIKALEIENKLLIPVGKFCITATYLRKEEKTAGSYHEQERTGSGTT